MVDGWGRERSRRGKESTSQRRERDGSRICKRQQLRQEYSTRRREQSEMVSSGKHRREKGKWKIEIRKAKFKSGDRARKNRFNTEDTERRAQSSQRRKGFRRRSRGRKEGNRGREGRRGR